jgi:DNA invertase Pin-like site-specific DNA recombinase
MKIGYARVSTQDQNLDLQIDALKRSGCDKIFTDRVSGAKFDRPGLNEALSHLRSGDTLVVWRLDRLGRKLKELIETVDKLGGQGIEFESITEKLDTSSPGGRMIFQVMGAMAEFERNIIRERTTAGLAAARARGRNGGRPKALSPEDIIKARKMYDSSALTVQEICDQFRCSRSAFYRQVAPKAETTK